MKRILGILFILAVMSKGAMAFQSTTWLSSNTATAESSGTLCGQFFNGSSTITLRGVLHGVCVNTAAAGNVQIYGSSWAALSPITGLYSTGTQVPCNFYDTDSPQGLNISKAGTADATILYQCY